MSAPRPRTRRVAGALAVIAGYAAVVGWLTWPLAAHLGTHLPATFPHVAFDPLYMGWLLAHESRALVSAPWTFGDPNIFHPAPNTLFYGDTGFGALPYFMPVFLATGNPTLALNLLFLGSVVLTAAAFHLVVVRWTGSHAAGLVAAWTFLTTRFVLWTFIPMAPSYSVLQYLPVIVFLAAVPAAGWRSALLLLPLVVLQCLSDVLYVAPAVVVPLVVIALGRLARRATRAAGLRLLAVLALALLALAPVYAGHLAVRAENPNLHLQTPWLWPIAMIPTVLPWGPLSPDAPTAVPLAALALIAAGGLSLALAAGRRPSNPARSAWMHGLLWAVVGLLMTITPAVKVDGRWVQLPHMALLKWLPIYQVLRTPERLGLASLAGLALLAGLAFARCARWLPAAGRRVPLARAGEGALALAVAGVMYVQYAYGLGVPAPLGMTPLPRAYPLAEAISPVSAFLEILREPGGPLLELPALAPEHHAQAMYRSIFHGRRLVNGYNSYWPQGFRERMELARRLPDPEALAALRRETRLELLLVHVDEVERYERRLCEWVNRGKRKVRPCDEHVGAAERAAWLGLAAAGRDDLRLVARDGDDLLFRVRGADGSSPSSR